ncbi:MAG: ankyrin repeat domain-containing protein, partial [Myxococcales bacterium]|nr:ankyrin repeat domain-containing protein [Myxococcales bacterium]
MRSLSVLSVLAALLVLPVQAQAAAPASTQVQQRKYLRTSYDDDARRLIGRFFPDDVASDALVEGMARETRCSAFIKPISVAMSGSEEEVLRQGGLMRRVEQIYDSKLVAEVDLKGFQNCCATYPDQCPRRYIDTVIKGQVFDRSDAQNREVRKETTRPQYYSFVVADSPMRSERTPEAASAAAVAQLLSRLPVESRPLDVAIEPSVDAHVDLTNADMTVLARKAAELKLREWVTTQMGSEISEHYERFQLTELRGATWQGASSGELPKGVRLLLSVRIIEKSDELEVSWRARFLDENERVIVIQLKPVSIALNFVPEGLLRNRVAAAAAPPVPPPPSQPSPTLPRTIALDVWDRDGDTQLTKAVKRNDLSRVQSLIEAGANVNATNQNGETALMLATSSERAALIQTLLAAGADVNAWDKDGETLLTKAVKKNDEWLVQMFIAARADLNAKNHQGLTALMIAAVNSGQKIALALIASGADVNATNQNGETALMGASYKGDLRIVQALIASGANVNAKDINGVTALMLAMNS